MNEGVGLLGANGVLLAHPHRVGNGVEEVGLADAVVSHNAVEPFREDYSSTPAYLVSPSLGSS